MTTIRDIAREYQKATGCLLPFSMTDDDLLTAMITDWRNAKKQRMELAKIKREMMEIKSRISSLFLSEEDDEQATKGGEK